MKLRLLALVCLTGITITVAVLVTRRIVESDRKSTRQATVLVSLASALLLSGVLGRALYARWVAPTRELTDAVQRMGNGEWTLRPAVQGADELQALAVRLNYMAQGVQSQLEDLTAQRGALQAMVDTLPDPIMTTDEKGKIVLINQPAARLLNLAPERARGTNVAMAVNDQAVLELFDAVAGDESSTSVAASVQRLVRLTRLGQRLTFQGFATRMAGGGVLLLLRDISELAANAQMKTDFVANASHELRTPIAAIKIAFDTLREVYSDDPRQADRCVHIIGGHLHRLEEMLRDLLDLSRVESPDLKPERTEIRTEETFARIRTALGPFAREKLVELKLGDEGGGETPAILYTDEQLLGLILKNLVENSIKFTPPGGTVSVGIRADKSGNRPDRVRITVADTGIGIPEEHVERVFERFYQVDPARSGAAGRGTGLGLAIVKHTAAALGGTIRVESKLGVGTTVTLSLPGAIPPAVT
jgi:two-component system phosphate regulon sensor histidine kinase PhoR